MTKRALKVIAGAMTVLMSLTTLTACGSSKSTTKESTQGTKNETTTQNGKLAKVELTMFSNDPQAKAFPWAGTIAEKITEKTGVSLKIETLNGMDQKQKKGIMVASGEYPDLLWNVTQDWADTGALITLDDKMDKIPNVKKAFGDSLVKLKYLRDSKIYLIPSPKSKPSEIADPNQCLLIQYDVLEKMGYPKIKTLDDVYKVLKEYTAKYPDINGKPFIPWGVWGDTWGYSITLNNPANWVNGKTDDSDDFIDQKTYDVKYMNATPMYKQYLQWLNKLYIENMIDKNAFITKNDQMKSLASTGRILATIDGTWDFTDVSAALVKAGMGERRFARLPIVADVSIKDRSQVECESYDAGLGISSKCKNVDAALRLIDYLVSDEGAIAMNWGVEGKTFDVVNGKRTLKKEIVQAKNADPDYAWKTYLGYFLCQTSGAVKLADGDYASPTNIESYYTDADASTKKVLDAYSVKAWGQLFDTKGEKTAYGYPWTLKLNPDGAGQKALTKADQYRHIQVPVIIMSKTEAEFTKNWEDFVKKLYEDCKIADYEKEKTEALKARMKLWGVLK